MSSIVLSIWHRCGYAIGTSPRLWILDLSLTDINRPLSDPSLLKLPRVIINYYLIREHPIHGYETYSSLFTVYTGPGCYGQRLYHAETSTYSFNTGNHGSPDFDADNLCYARIPPTTFRILGSSDHGDTGWLCTPRSHYRDISYPQCRWECNRVYRV